MMRCKVGDMATVIQSSFPENIGVLVKIIEPGDVIGEWHIHAIGEAELRSEWHWEMITIDIHSQCSPSFPDGWLQPIRGEAKDVTTTKTVERDEPVTA